MKNFFNVLYWNIHYMEGFGYDKSKLETSSNLICDIINDDKTYEDINNIKNIDDIDAIVFTEAYPQVSKINLDENIEIKENNIILEKFKDKFDIFPYYPTKDYLNKKIECEFPFQKITFANTVIIMVKKEMYNMISINKYSPNMLCIEKKDNSVMIIGVRVTFDDNKSYEENLNKIKNVIKDKKDEKIIIVGDFNPSRNENIKNIGNNIYEEGKKYLEKEFEEMQCYKCNSGTNTSVSKGYAYNTYPDFLLLKNCSLEKVEDFDRVKTVEEIYCKEEYICSEEKCDKCIYDDYCREYIEKEKVSKKDLYGHIMKKKYDEIQEKINEKENEIKKINKKRSPEVKKFKLEIDDIKREIVKNEYKGKIYIKYDNRGICNSPFPDHNLLFASINTDDKHDEVEK